MFQLRDPIIEIAITQEFSDQRTFTRQFRKRTGLTPRQFRIRNQDRFPALPLTFSEGRCCFHS
jgi:AraC-like DNA-binding protein